MMPRRIAWVALSIFAAAIVAGVTLRAQQDSHAPAPTGAGTLVVVVDPPAALYVDGGLVTADTTRHETKIPAGLRRIRITHPDYQDVVRRIRIEPDKTVTLALSLPERAVRKSAAAPPPARGRGAAGNRATAGGRGTSASDLPPGVTDPELITGIEFVRDGDFEPAVDTLTAVARNLAGTPRYVGQQAVAFLYLGAALIELDRVDLAKRAFALAQRTDKSLVARPTQFSRLTLITWESARSIPPSEEIDLDSLTIEPEPPPAPEPPPPATPPPSENLEPAREVDPEAPFISEVEGALLIDFAVATTGLPCLGTLMVNPGQQLVSWEPKGAGCLSSFDVPFAEVRSPAAAPRGGVLLQFRSARQSVTLMPLPDADLLEPDREKLTLNDLPPSTRVHTRSALKRIFRALDRSWTDSISSLLVDVPVAELTENPADYDGGIVRTSGTLVTNSAKKGPYFISDDNASIQVVASGPAMTMMRSKASEWVGRELIVSGAFSRPAAISSRGGPANVPSPFLLTATKIEPADEVKYTGPARQLTLEQIVKDPPWNRELVRVIGKYRGANTFGDMPLESRRNSSDWVIRDSVFSVWVTGRKAAGNGFDLDSSAARDVTSFWVAVTGRVEHRKGFVYMKAEKVELSPTEFRKDPGAVMRTGPSVRTRPDIVHIDPSESVEISPDQQLLVQFTKPMDDKTTVPANVQLRYSDGTPANFPYLLVTYYPERHSSVIIDPGTVLIPNKTIEVVFLPGIKDIDGLPLAGTDAPNGRVLKWRVKRR